MEMLSVYLTEKLDRTEAVLYFLSYSVPVQRYYI